MGNEVPWSKRSFQLVQQRVVAQGATTTCGDLRNRDARSAERLFHRVRLRNTRTGEGPPQRFFRTLILATIPWFIAYAFFEAIPDTADRVEINWMTFPFHVFPLQLFLATAAAGALEASSKRPIKRAGARLTIIVWILILGHIVITAWTL